ncbi:MAG: hypothetical protein GF364_20530 [Candidatus Lokiarchaeota archaeon]|nr:hypothetical protein [Candidatus Lokiarchaeota archaeon]
MIENLESCIKEKNNLLEESLEKQGIDTIKNIKEIVKQIAAEDKNYPRISVNSYQNMISRLRDYFQEKYDERSQRYETLFKERFGSSFKNIDSMLENLEEIIDNHKDAQEKHISDIQNKNTEKVQDLKETLELQLKELSDRIESDIKSLLRANKEILGKIVVQYAQFGNDTSNISEEIQKTIIKLSMDFIKKMQK